MLSLQNYIKTEDTFNIKFSYDTRSVFFQNNGNGTYQLYQTFLKNLSTKKITPGDRTVFDPYPLSDGSVIFLMDDEGNEFYQLWLYQENSITKLTNDISTILFSYEDSRFIYFVNNKRNERYFDIYRWEIPLLENSPELIFENNDTVFHVSATNYKEKYIILKKTIQFGSKFQLYQFFYEEDKLIYLTEDHDDSQGSNWKVSGFLDTYHLIISTNSNHDLFYPGLLDLNSRQISLFGELLDINLELDHILYRKSINSLILIYNNRGYSKIMQYELDDKQLKEIELPFPSYISTAKISCDGKKLGLSLERFDRLNSVYIYNFATEEYTEIYSGSTLLNNFPSATLHCFLASDGIKIDYFKLVPKKIVNKPLPTIFFIHGGPEVQSRPTFDGFQQYLLSKNYAIIIPNIRGSSGYGKKFSALDDRHKRLDAVRDIHELRLHLLSDDDIDNENIVLYGESYGGFVVLSAMTIYPNWKGGIDMMGISNFVTFLENTAIWRREDREREYGQLEKDREFLESISPLHTMDQIQAPLFIIHGENDPRIPLNESLQLYHSLRDQGKNVELLTYPEGHGLLKFENRIDAYTKLTFWLDDMITS